MSACARRKSAYVSLYDFVSGLKKDAILLLFCCFRSQQRHHLRAQILKKRNALPFIRGGDQYGKNQRAVFAIKDAGIVRDIRQTRLWIYMP